MATEEQKKEAQRLYEDLIGLNALPSSLRSPLNAVMAGTEVKGTAQGVLQYAGEVLNAVISNAETEMENEY